MCFLIYTIIRTRPGLKIGTIRLVNAILSQLFTMAQKSNIIKADPVTGANGDVDKKIKEKPRLRIAMTIEEQEMFVNFVYNSR